MTLDYELNDMCILVKFKYQQVVPGVSTKMGALFAFIIAVDLCLKMLIIESVGR